MSLPQVDWQRSLEWFLIKHLFGDENLKTIPMIAVYQKRKCPEYLKRFMMAEIQGFETQSLNPDFEAV